MPRNYFYWTETEIEYLKANYGLIPPEELSENLRCRRIKVINQKAMKLNLKHPLFAVKKSNLEILLENTPASYYWIGFLLADGSFTDRRIQLGTAKKDEEHLKKFLSYVNSTNKIRFLENYCKVKLTNVSVVQELRKKFNISSNKTYEPCLLSTLPQDDLFFSLIIGFFDGDGTLSKVKYANSYQMSLIGHSSWLNNFKLMKEFLCSYCPIERQFSSPYIRDTVVKLPGKTIYTKHKLACFQISYRPLLISIKQKADQLELPYLNRKLGQVQ